MQITQNRLFNFFILLLTVLLFVTCSIERKIAKTYVKSEKQPSVLLFFPEEILKSNLKTEEALASDSIRFWDVDSIVQVNDLFLSKINDSAFISKCKQSLVKELQEYGFRVYEPSQIDELINSPDTSYVFSLVQMQLEEYLYPDKVETSYYGKPYRYEFSLNAINLNSWFELNMSKITPDKYPILYSSYFIYDELDGEFVPVGVFDESLNFRYKIDSMDVADVYNLAELAGKKYAINFYDYLLNIHIQDNLPKGVVPRYYYHYNRKTKSLQTYYYDGFIEIEP